MVNLSDTIKWIIPGSGSTVIARVDSKALTPSVLPQVLLVNSENINRIVSGQIQASRYEAVVIPEKLSDAADWKALGTPVALFCESLAHLSHGDVIRIEGVTNRTRV